MVGEILNQGGKRHRNPSTPRAINNHNNFLKAIKERSLILYVLLYNATSTDLFLVVVLLRIWIFLKKLFGGQFP